jgi:hypothetical protein
VNQCVLLGLVHSWLETPLRVGRFTGRAILLPKIIWADKSDDVKRETRKSQLPKIPFLRIWGSSGN